MDSPLLHWDHFSSSFPRKGRLMKNIFSSFIHNLYHWPLLTKIFPTQISCLQKALADCHSVLDLGCGPSSPIQYIHHLKKTVGVEIFPPYLQASQKNHIHHSYIAQDISKLDLPEKSFDAVVLIEVIEHLEESSSQKILQQAERWARKKVIVTSPNGFIPQKAVDNNPYQEHLSGWPLKTMKNLGYHCQGLCGLKVLRQEVQDDTMDSSILTSIRWHPRLFWFIIATLSQSITYYFPKNAFGLFSIKRVDHPC